MAAPKAADIAVHSPRSPEERDRIYAFRYRIEIIKKAGVSVFADDKNKIVKDPFDDAACQLCLVRRHSVSASVRINSVETTNLTEQTAAKFQLGKFSNYQREDLSLTSRLVVAEDDDSGRLASVLLGAAYKVARKMGSRFDLTSCPPPMVPLYEHLGYRRYGPNFVDEDEVYQVPLVLLTEDVEHLKKIGSPFYRLASAFRNTGETSQWFEKTFPESVHTTGERTLDEEKFWSVLTKKLQQTPLEGVPLLANLDYADAKRVLHAGSTLQCNPGDRIVQAGGISREMYVILSGNVEVRTGERMVAKLGRGDIFGESALISSEPRTADVVALDDVEVLTLSHDFLEKGMKDMPEIISRVLYNLSMTLVERLRESTSLLADGVAPAPHPADQDQRRSA